MFLNKGQTEKIKQQLPVREACGDVGLFARAVGGNVRGRGEIGNCYRLVPERRQHQATGVASRAVRWVERSEVRTSGPTRCEERARFAQGERKNWIRCANTPIFAHRTTKLPCAVLKTSPN